MVQVRDIFGKVLESPKRTRTRTSAAPVITTQHQTTATPVATDSNDLVTRLISLSNNPMFMDLKKDEEIICRRILKIETDKNKVLRKTEALLTQMPNYSVCQAINRIENRFVFVLY